MGILGTLFLLFFVVPFLWGLLKGLVGAVFELPLYLALTPLRFANAVAFNLILRPI